VKLELDSRNAQISIHPPHHFWVMAGVSLNYPDFEPGHGWLYQGLVRRDAWRLGPICLYVMRMPRK
jgi:hypothetical protein